MTDIGDIVSGQAFDVDYSDPNIPLQAKLQNDSAMVIVVGHKYAKTAVVSCNREGKFLIEDERVFSEQTITLAKDLFQWVWEQTEFKEIEKKHKIKKYIVGMYPDSLDTIMADCDTLDVGQRWDPAKPELYAAAFEKALQFDTEVLVNKIPNQKYSPELHYGYVMLPKVGKVVVFGGPRAQISPIIEDVNARGSLIRFSLYPSHLFSALVEEGVVENKEIGCAFVYGNRTLITVGWRWDESAHIFVQCKRVGIDQTTPSSPKNSLLGKIIQGSLRTWSDKGKLGAQKILPDKLGFYYQEISGDQDVKQLESVLRDVLGERVPNIHTLNFHKIFDVCSNGRANNDSYLEILPLLK
jgi:hypothetical protein